MMLYIDETENNKMFMVVGLLVNSKSDIDMSFKRFKKQAQEVSIKTKYKGLVFTEFKSTLLDRSYHKIKTKMLNEIQNLDNRIIYSCYMKKDLVLKQSIKEKIYIKLLEKIVNNIEDSIDIVFDGFNKKSFETRIVNRLSLYDNVSSITSGNSQTEAGLKYVDNICSVIRLHKSNEDRYKFYELIQDSTIQI